MNKKNTNRNRELAFTLIEVILSIALTASIMTIAYTFYNFSLHNSTNGMNNIDIQKKVRIAIEQITRDIRSAKEIIRIEPGAIELKTFFDEKEEHSHIDFNDHTRKVKYEFVKRASDKDNDSIVAVRDNVKMELIKFNSIDENIFEAYTLDPNKNLILFDHRENDSIMRSKISIIKIKFQVKNGDATVNINTSVNPRYLSGFNNQPNWNLTK